MKQNFLEMIREDPNSDEPRLVYSDWLEEQGDPLGKLIRIQCELAAIPNKSLERESKEILAQHRENWLDPLKPIRDSLEVERGFVKSLGTSPRLLLQLDETIADLAPVLQNLEVHFVLPSRDQLWIQCLETKTIRDVPSLSLRHSMLETKSGKGNLDHLLANASEMKLTSLDLSSLEMGNHPVAMLVEMGTNFKHLRRLHLAGNRLSDQTVEKLLESPTMTQLEFVDLRRNQLSDGMSESLSRTFGPRILL